MKTLAIRLILVGVIAGLYHAGFAQSGRGQEEQRKAGREQIAELVAQLDAADRETREAAQASLIELGPSILPLLPDPDDPSLSAEQQDRLRRVIAALEAKRRAAIIAPSRVTLGPGQYTLSELLERLEKATGNRIHDLRAELGQPVQNPTIDVSWKNTPFWTAFLELARKAGLRIAPYESRESIAVASGSIPPVPMAIRGAVIGYVREVVLRRQLEIRSTATELSLVIGWEPRLTVVRARVRVAALEVETDAGGLVSAVEQPQPVAVPLPRPVVEAHPDGAKCFVELPVILPALPPPGATRLTRVAVPLELFVAGMLQKVELGPLRGKAPLQARVEDATISVVRAVDEEGIWRIQVQVEYERDDAEPATESFESWFLRNPVRLVHRTTGKAQPCNGGFNLVSTGDRSFAVEYFFVDLPGKLSDYDFVYELPRRPEWVRARLEFQNVPLPFQGR